MPGLVALFAVQHDRDGTIVVNLDQHVLLKDARPDMDATSFEKASECLNEWLGDVGWCGVGESGAAALAGARIESELADDEGCSSRVEQGQIELAGVVGENAEVGAPLGEVAGIGFGIVLADSQEDHHSVVDRGDWPPLDAH